MFSVWQKKGMRISAMKAHFSSNSTQIHLTGNRNVTYNFTIPCTYKRDEFINMYVSVVLKERNKEE